LDSDKQQKRLLEAPIFADQHLYDFQKKKPKEVPGPARVIYTAGMFSGVQTSHCNPQLNRQQILTSISVVLSPTSGKIALGHLRLVLRLERSRTWELVYTLLCHPLLD
jgi:hypothetical protein